MTGALRDLLQQDVASVEIPMLDPNEVIVQGERLLHRRRLTALLSVVVAITVIAVGGVVAGSQRHDSQGPVDKPTEVNTPTIQAEPTTRKLVYVDGFWPVRKIHMNNQIVDISDQLPQRGEHDEEWGMVFLQVAGDGVVLVTHDGRIWFTDGDEVAKIGQLGYGTLIRTAGALHTGLSGPLAAWVEVTGGSREMVVYDTTRRATVLRTPCQKCGDPDIAGRHVYWATNDDGRGPWMMFDAESARVRRVPATAYAEDLASQPRALVVGDSRATGQVETGLAQEFLGVHGHLVPLADPAEPGVPVHTKAWDTGTGKQLHLRLPSAYDRDTLRLFDWLDDDRMALAVNDEIGRVGDIVVCRISTGSCRLAVPGTPPRFVPNIGVD